MSEVSSEVIESLKLRPGEGLKRLREAAGLSLWTWPKLRALPAPASKPFERDDYASAGQSPAHVIGYMRAYSRLLVISADPWLACLSANCAKRLKTSKTSLA